MKIETYKTVQSFMKPCGDFLKASEVEHNLFLSLCAKTEKGEFTDVRFLAGFEDDGDVAVCAIQTVPHNLVLSRATDMDLMPLARAVNELEMTLPGVVGPSNVATTFTDLWAEVTGEQSLAFTDQIIYALKKVSMPSVGEGHFAQATPEYRGLATEWLVDFTRETMPPTEQVTMNQARDKIDAMVASGDLVFWIVNRKPVAMASVYGFTENTARISAVYTPPSQRGRGYASAVVAHLSQRQLDSGKKSCCLYADAKNPVSNSIYRKIGYEFVGRSTHYMF